MIFQKLPRSIATSLHRQTGIFPDHTFFTEKIGHPYEYPEHTAGLGIVSMRSGKGECSLNGKREQLDSRSFLVVNQGSRLSVQVKERDAQPFLLFFHTRLVDRMLHHPAHSNSPAFSDCSPHSNTSSQERVPEPGSLGFSCLERLHSKPNTLNDRLEWLARLGNSCSSFCNLKADNIVRGILEELMKEAHMADRLSGRLPVTRSSTRVELYKRLSLTRDWIRINYAAPITMEDMATVAMLNGQHLLRMFRHCYQVTPHQFLVHTRLEQARHLLRYSAEGVSVICRSTGFESISSFSGLFKQRYGMPPSLFRRQ